jgi:hypothetical protein
MLNNKLFLNIPKDSLFCFTQKILLKFVFSNNFNISLSNICWKPLLKLPRYYIISILKTAAHITTYCRGVWSAKFHWILATIYKNWEGFTNPHSILTHDNDERTWCMSCKQACLRGYRYIRPSQLSHMLKKRQDTKFHKGHKLNAYCHRKNNHLL